MQSTFVNVKLNDIWKDAVRIDEVKIDTRDEINNQLFEFRN